MRTLFQAHLWHVLQPQVQSFLHDCLSHPSLAKLKIIAPSLKQLQVLGCESCQLERHVRSSSPKQTKKICN